MKKQKNLGTLRKKMSGLDRLIKEMKKEVMIQVLTKYVKLSERKVALKKGYIRMVVLELASQEHLTLPEDLRRTLESFDDELQPVTVMNYNAPILNNGTMTGDVRNN